MAIELISSHVSGDFASERLTVRLLREDFRAGVTREDTLSFSVPADYHVHNDLVAAALLAVIGPNEPQVRLNFPISTRCAERLRDFYRLADIEPVDPDLAPRAGGRHLGISFSGGTDSMSLYLSLERAGLDFKVITADFGAWLAIERDSFLQFRRDITCEADYRRKGYGSGSPWLVTAVPLLFADYLDLYGLALGAKQDEARSGMRVTPQRPDYHPNMERVLGAGGVRAVYVTNALMTPGVLRLVKELAPEKLEAGLRSADAPGTQKYLRKAWLARWLYEHSGEPVPPFLRQIPPATAGQPFGRDTATDISGLFLARQYGSAFADLAVPGLARHALDFLGDLSLECYLRYNPIIAATMPDAMREPVLALWRGFGVLPYDERDWFEREQINEFILRTRDKRRVSER